MNTIRHRKVPQVKTIVLIQWLFVTIVFVAPAWSQSIDGEKPTAEQLKFFESKIRPVLARECYGCHATADGQLKGGLWLDTREGARIGGDSGPAVVPHDLETSLLWNAINHIDYSMPPRKKLSNETLADFKTWIEMGAPDPREQPAAVATSTLTDEDIANGKKFWSFQPPKSPTVPVSKSNWAATEIDRFIEAKLNEHDLQPSADASPTTLLRRLCFDLIGLPPTPEQIVRFEAFWQQDPQNALEKTVDELLSQPQFGERWGRHWLDVARYAESTGKELNLTFPHAWRYRDYVIDSFNDDKPYSRFVQEQLAGDLLPVKTDEQWFENLVATGFLTFGPKSLNEVNGRQFQLDLIDEQIDVTTRVMLGVSVACARCHDHKFDPIRQSDYYAVAGIFNNMTTHYGTFATQQNRRPTNLVIAPIKDLGPNEKPISAKQLAELKAQLAQVKSDLVAARQQRANQKSNTNTARNSIASLAILTTQAGMLEAQINAYDELGNPLTYCMAVQDSERPTNATLLERGEFDKPVREIPRGFPQVLSDESMTISKQSSGRLEFALWVGNEQNPLTARVMVNRVWQHLLGNGLVRTPEDFGSTGLAPTHPELLDHLAVEFMQRDWSVKQLIRSIVLSRVYRTSSDFHHTSFEKDPENKYLWRIDPKRLDAELIRDSMLAISGELDPSRPRATLVAEVGNAIVRDGNMIATRSPTESAMEPSTRRARFGGDRMGQLRPVDRPSKHRSVYLPIVRDNVPRSLEVFDFAESTMVVGQRETSNTPDQGLYFLNNGWVIDQADAMARRLMAESKKPNEQIEQAFLLAFGRPATGFELRAADRFYRNFRPTPSRSKSNDASLAKLSAVCQSIMASAEFRFLN